MQVVERQLKETQVAVQALSSEKQQLQDEDEELIKRRAKLEFDVRDLRDRVADDHQSKVRGMNGGREGERGGVYLHCL